MVGAALHRYTAALSAGFIAPRVSGTVAVAGGRAIWFPAVPLFLVMASPIIEKAIFDNGIRELRATLVLGATGIGIQILAIANHFDWYFGLLRSQDPPASTGKRCFSRRSSGSSLFCPPYEQPLGSRECPISIRGSVFTHLRPYLDAGSRLRKTLLADKT